MLYYYSATTRTIANIIYYLSYIIVAIGWLALVVGIVSRSLAGL